MKAPIIEALRNYIENSTTRFHMPGHKGGRNINNMMTDFLGGKVFAADVTNVPGMDDLHQAHGIIRDAQRLASEAFGADDTYFLINGSSCGLQALILTVCNPGDKILVPRNIHRSILSGIILSGAIPIFFMPEYDRNFNIALGTLPETIERNLRDEPTVKAVLIVNPTYHGIISNVSEIAQIVHKYNIPLLVDEAHGPHLGFHPELPKPSLQQGADAVVHGTHKILSSFTQSSMLHIKGQRINRQRLESVLKVLQSTSTSYLLLASLDAARAEIVESGNILLQNALNMSNELKNKIREISQLSLLDEAIVGKSGVFALDPTKITISFKELKVTGLWAEQWLRSNYHIQVEMSDIFNILLIIGFGNSELDTRVFVKALNQMIKDTDRIFEKNYSYDQINSVDIILNIPELAITPREAFMADNIRVPLKEAVGRISTETIACYPPGIPVICPGEKITEHIIRYLIVMRELGVHMQGCYDSSVQTISVVK